MNILYIQSYGNKAFDLKWVNEIQKDHFVKFLGCKELDGLDENLEIMDRTIIFDEILKNKYDFLICSSRDGEVLYHAIQKMYEINLKWIILCIIINGFKDGFEKKYYMHHYI